MQIEKVSGLVAEKKQCQRFFICRKKSELNGCENVRSTEYAIGKS